MALEKAQFEGAEQKERKERVPKKAKTKRTKQSQEITENLSNYGINKALIFIATHVAEKEIKPKPSSFKELYEKNPALVLIIKGVAEYFGIPAAVLFATFHHESGFKHKEKGDLTYHGGPSVGIGQFQEGTWSDLNTKKKPEFKEFRKFMNKFYPGKKFERGDNLLADIAASAALIKKHGGTRIDWEKPAPHRILRARALYTGDRDYHKQMLIFLGKQKGKVKTQYPKFLKTYEMYNKGWEEHQGLAMAD